MLFNSIAYGLLASSALAAPALRRDMVVEDVVITDAVTVVEQADGSFVTQAAVAVGTTVDRTTVVVPTSAAPAPSSQAPSPSPAPEPKSSPAAKAVVSNPAPAVMQQSPSPAPAPSSSSSSSSSALPTITSTVPLVLAAPTKVALVSTPAAQTTTSSSSTPSSTSAVAAPTMPNTPAGGPKRGLAYNDVSFLSAFAGSLSNWCYNWGSTSGGDVPSDLQYVPMLWSDTDTFTSDWDDAVSTAKAAGSTHLLAFNEPDLAAQANLPYAQAASSYMTYLQPHADDFKLGAPAVTNGDPASGMGLGYLKSFLSSCESLGCTIDFVPIHWYNDASQVEDFKTHVSDAYTAGGNRPVWITEIGASGSDAEQESFLAEVIPWLEAQDYVERYAYFMVQDGSLMSGNSVSALGKAYAFASS